jgi:hypothetical protein
VKFPTTFSIQRKDDMQTRIVLIIDGGLIQDSFTDNDGVEILILDRDNIHQADDVLNFVSQDEEFETTVDRITPAYSSDFVQEAFDQVADFEKKNNEKQNNPNQV